MLASGAYTRIRYNYEKRGKTKRAEQTACLILQNMDTLSDIIEDGLDRRLAILPFTTAVADPNIQMADFAKDMLERDGILYHYVLPEMGNQENNQVSIQKIMK